MISDMNSEINWFNCVGMSCVIAHKDSPYKCFEIVCLDVSPSGDIKLKWFEDSHISWEKSTNYICKYVGPKYYQSKRPAQVSAFISWKTNKEAFFWLRDKFIELYGDDIGRKVFHLMCVTFVEKRITFPATLSVVGGRYYAKSMSFIVELTDLLLKHFRDTMVQEIIDIIIYKLGGIRMYFSKDFLEEAKEKIPFYSEYDEVSTAN